MSEKTKVVGVTGPTGAGKSTVCRSFQKSGCEIIDADEIAHDILKNNPECKQDIIKSFSEEILNNDGEIDRKKLAKKAFRDVSQTEILNNIMYPHIVIKIANDLFECQKNGVRVCVIDAAQLFESGIDKFCDVVIAVLAPYRVRLERIMNRDNMSEHDAKMRLEVQSSDEFYKSKTPYIIDGTKFLQ